MKCPTLTLGLPPRASLTQSRVERCPLGSRAILDEGPPEKLERNLVPPPPLSLHSMVRVPPQVMELTRIQPVSW